jgi:hypothetical protein
MLPSQSDDPARPEQMMQFLQSIKGAPASVLLALAFTGRYMSHHELQLWTRCGKDQITLALQILIAQGWAANRTSRGPWILRQRLPTVDPDFLGARIPLKGPSSGSDSLNTVEEETLLPSPSRKEMLEALYAVGIREPTASELVELPHMTPEYLQAHVQAARAHGLRIGSAIENMRLGAPPLHAPAPQDRQAEVAEKIRRFSEGR